MTECSQLRLAFPGQALRRASRLYKNFRMSFVSLLTGSFSTPAGENPTVAMVEAAYRDLGLDARYINCEVAPEALRRRGPRRPRDGLGGLQLLAPAQGHGDRAPRGLARVGRGDRRGQLRGRARRAADRREHRRAGLPASLAKTVVDPAGKALALFGAGGAARAIAVEAALAGAARITVINRDRRAAASWRAAAQRPHAGRGGLRALGGRVGVPEGTASWSTRPRSGSRTPTRELDVDLSTLRPRTWWSPT